MEPASDMFEEAAVAYTSLVRQISLDAAAAIEQIHTTFGSHAALRAALIITILKIEVLQNGWIPNFDTYDHLLEDYADTLPLARKAMTCCLKVWAISIQGSTADESWRLQTQ